jgi:membrane protease YdiL (CAAX protease family)
MSEIPEAGVPRPSAERVFPPWPAGRIVVWIAVGVVLSIVIGTLIGIGAATLSIWLTGGVGESVAQATGFLAALLQGAIVFLLIWFLLKRCGFSLGNAWGSFSVKAQRLGLVALAGAAFMSAADLLARVFHTEIVPTASISWDWRLVLASEILTTGFVAAISEELLFRGLLYRAFRLRFSALDAMIFSSLIFALTHTQYFRNPYYLAVVFLTGSVCALLLENTRSLNSSIAFHVAANTTTITTYYLIYYSS